MKLKLYEQIAMDIEQTIRGGRLAPGDPLMPEIEIAEKYGVSRSTVRQALSQLKDRGLITREAGRGTFVCPPLPSSVYLAVYDNFSRLFDPSQLFFRIWRTIVERMSDAGVDVHAIALDTKRPLKEVLTTNYPPGMRGFLLLTYRPVESSDISPLTQKGVPCILLNRHVHAPGVHNVTLDDFGGTRRAFHYLNERGHTRIGLMTLKASARTTFNDRIAGYARAVEEAGLKPYIFETADNNNTIQETLARAVATGISAVITISGSLAISVKRSASQLGLRVPEDVSIIGFGDTTQVSTEKPPITHVDYHANEIGRVGAETMLDLLAGKTNLPTRKIIPTDIIEGGTVSIKQ